MLTTRMQVQALVYRLAGLPAACKTGMIQGRLMELGIDDFRGSSHIIAMARSVMGLSVVQTTPTLDRNGPRKLEIIKTNLGPYPRPLGFEFAPLQAGGVFLKWGQAPKAYHEPTQLEKCVAWLQDVLSQSDAPLKPGQVIELGEGEGFSRALVYHARETLGDVIENTHGRKHPDNCWKWAQKEDES